MLLLSDCCMLTFISSIFVDSPRNISFIKSVQISQCRLLFYKCYTFIGCFWFLLQESWHGYCLNVIVFICINNIFFKKFICYPNILKYIMNNFKSIKLLFCKHNTCTPRIGKNKSGYFVTNLLSYIVWSMRDLS